MKYLPILITAILFILLFFPLFQSLVSSWLINEDYSHGFFIPLLSAYFLWRKKEELKNTAISPSAFGIFFILLGIIIFLASRTYIFALHSFSMLVVLFGLVCAHAGKEMAKKVFFSIFYLIFMIPLPGFVYIQITFYLRLLSTKLAFFIIRLLGISATRDGNIINLPTCALIVANPCSGLRSLVTFMAASLAIGYIFQKSIKNRILLFIFSIILAILLNMTRLVITAFFANLLKLKEITGSVHDTAGIVVIIVGFLILFLANDALAKTK